MKIKTDTEFQTFNKGVCDIYSVDDDAVKTERYVALAFDIRVLGFKRFFAGASVQTKVDKVIRIPKVPGIQIYDTVEIAGLGKFRIEIIQDDLDTNPLSIDLTLKQLEMFI